MVPSEADAAPEDRAEKPREQRDFDERVRRRRIEDWRAKLLVEREDNLRSRAYHNSPSKVKQRINNGGALSSSSSSSSSPNNPMMHDITPIGNTNSLHSMNLLYTEVKVCDACYTVYKELDATRRNVEAKEEKART